MISREFRVVTIMYGVIASVFITVARMFLCGCEGVRGDLIEWLQTE